MRAINPKTPIGTKLVSRWSQVAGEAMTAVLVDFKSGRDSTYPYRNTRPYTYESDCRAPNGERKPYLFGAARSEINRHWRIAEFSIVGFEGFGYEVTELALKAAWSIVRSCAGFNMDFSNWTITVKDGALDWSKGAKS